MGPIHVRGIGPAAGGVERRDLLYSTWVAATGSNPEGVIWGRWGYRRAGPELAALLDDAALDRVDGWGPRVRTEISAAVNGTSCR